MARLTRLCEREQWDDLLLAVNEYLRADPRSRSGEGQRVLHLFAGSAHMGLGQFARATASLSRGIELGAEFASYWYSRAVCFLALANQVSGPESVIRLRRCLIDLDEALLREPGHAPSSTLRKQIGPILGESNGPQSERYYWAIAEKVAKVAGAFVRSALS